jgi:hypothetical protein
MSGLPADSEMYLVRVTNDVEADDNVDFAVYREGRLIYTFMSFKRMDK